MLGSKIYQQQPAIRRDKEQQNMAAYSSKEKGILQERRNIVLEARVKQKVCGLRQDKQLLLKWVQGGTGLAEREFDFGQRKKESRFSIKNRFSIQIGVFCIGRGFQRPQLKWMGKGGEMGDRSEKSKNSKALGREFSRKRQYCG